mmetsp:Transcript_18209/g.45975  ORF Transcript_18209/g.45975 Transcript_18209/m.45975 type:complete len:442 (+) Transcript_18209:581-1906(+)
MGMSGRWTHHRHGRRAAVHPAMSDSESPTQDAVSARADRDSDAESGIVKPRPACRLLLRLDDDPAESPLELHLSSQVCDFGPPGLLTEKFANLGPDPLRGDADPSRLWTAAGARPNRPVGAVLMDQALVAGVGNIFRAEILFEAGVHPARGFETLDEAERLRLWESAKRTLRVGFETGSILTVTKADAKRLGAPWTRRYVYNQAACGVCVVDHGRSASDARVKTWVMEGRKVFCCPRCQPLDGGGEGKPETALTTGAMRNVRNAEVFSSHCAGDSMETVTVDTIGRLTVAKLRAALGNLTGEDPPAGIRKKALQDIVIAAMQERDSKGAAKAEATEAAQGVPAASNPVKNEAAATGTNLALPVKGEEDLVASGVAGKAEARELEFGIVSNRRAAEEKVRAGEGRNVEHVAVVDEDGYEGGGVGVVLTARWPQRKRRRVKRG